MLFLRLTLALLLALPVLVKATAQGRTLSWDAIRVKAHLDAEGQLHVIEEQSYVFNGAWNGGERGFDVREGQTLQVNSMQRRDASGQLVPMSYGSTDVVDGWSMFDGNMLRWRARMPDDPPFRNARLTYVIDYTIGGVLVRRGSAYRLAHDFLFDERPGDVRQFTVDLTLDPVWHSDNLPRHVEETSPRGGVVVKGDLEYRGTGAPAAPLDPRLIAYALLAAVLLIPLILWMLLVRRERKLGRLEPMPQATPSWIEENILPLPAEVAGATWDEAIGANEVSALIARWAAEGKVTTNDRDGELTMTLTASRDEFPDYERALIDKLFFAGNNTSTTAIKVHYAESGFNPTSEITAGLTRKMNEILPQNDPAPRVSWYLPSLALFAITVILAIRVGKGNEDAATFGFFALLFLGLVLWFIGWAGATGWRGRIDLGIEGAKGFRIVAAIMVAAAAIALLLDWFVMPAKIALVTAALFVVNSTFNAAKSKKGPAAIAYRKRLASVRQYFIEELKKPNPAIDDRWVPYLIAFGLDDEASQWMKEFGAATNTSYGSYTSHTSYRSDSSSSPRWTGGGGAFGGAGATGGWSAAAAGMAAGVAAPSSSSSGGSSGGGGSSSGGGSGGGW